MKAQSPLLSHSFAIGFSILLVLMVTATFSYLDGGYRSEAGDRELRQLCDIIGSGTEKIYNPGAYRSPTSSIMGRVKLILPEKIAGIIYRADFVNDSLRIRTLADPVISTECGINVNASLSGMTYGGETEITWTTYPDRMDEIVMRGLEE